ncbi:MAG: AAA family ATPase [Planctomycetaceae bacterium]
MKLTEIDIDRFRIWRNLLLRLDPKGLNVIYGPNEAGKTTLMRFIRSTLYGYEPLSTEPAFHRPDAEQPWRGAVRCEHGGRTWRIHRRAELAGRGRLRISGGQEGIEKDAALDNILSGTTEDVYADIFAVGVRELQQLATLGTNQVAEYIYGLSLGPQGRQILDSLADVKERRASMFAEDNRSGQIPELFDKYASLSGSRRNSGLARDKHAKLTRRRRELVQEIEELQERESSISNELRGLRFLQNCHKPWKRIKDLKEELFRLQVAPTNPTEALKLLTAAEKDLQESSNRRDKLNEQAAQLRSQAERLQTDQSFDKERYAIQSLVDQSDWLRQIEEQIRNAEDRSSELRRELNHQMTQLGTDWSVERLNSIDTSPAAHHRLLEAARRYQDVLQRSGKLRRMLRSMTRRSQKELVELNSQLDFVGVPVSEAIEIEHSQLQELENLGRLRLQEEQLALKIQTVRRVIDRVDTDESIPAWVDKTITTMGWIGAALCLFGIATFSLGGEPRRALGGALAAAAFGFAGIMWWGVRNGLRNNFDAKVGIKLDDIADEARQADRQLRLLQERIGRMALADRFAGREDNAENWKSSTAEMVDRIGDCSARIADLEVLQRKQTRAAARRMRLKLLRDRYKSAQQNVNEHRQEWCRVLTSLGMDETVRVEQAFDWWRRIQEVREMLTQWRNSAPEVEGLRRMFEAMRVRVEQLGTRLTSARKLNFTRPLEVLTSWQQELKTHDRDRTEKSRLLADSETRQRDALHAQHQVEAAELRRSAVFARSGVSSREELTKQQESETRRVQLESQLKKANEELIDVSSAETELAIVEDDLVRFDAFKARETIQLRTSELADVEQRLNKNHEELGSLKQEIRLLESSRDSHAEFFKKNRVATEIYRATEDWFALQIEYDAVVQIRRRFEQENISGTLVTASDYMHRMTSGRYHRIWAPLGEDFLCIDDEYGQTFRVEQLSGGTREQLFLAIRFALVREFAKRGVELPLVMDDLFVNFDQERTEAAADCLLEVAREGQQVLFFTCHEHIAQLFQQKQIEPLWLPGHKVAYDAMKPEQETSQSGDAHRIEGRNIVSDSDELLDDSWDQPTSSDSVA